MNYSEIERKERLEYDLSKNNYIFMIKKCTSVQKIADYVRAHGLQYLVWKINSWRTEDILRNIINVEISAQEVEKCKNVKEAREYLKSKGYW